MSVRAGSVMSVRTEEGTGTRGRGSDSDVSVRVNLLPQETSARHAAERQRILVAGGVLGVIALLGVITLWQNGRIADAEAILGDERAILAALQADEARLAEFADLEARIRTSQRLTAAAMGNEVSFAGLLQDVAAVTPSDIELESLNVTVAPHAPAPGIDSWSIGTLTVVGYSLNGHVPGVERFLLELDKVAAFHDLFVSGSRTDDPEAPYPQFTVEAQLGPQILTDRYADGLPETLR